MIICFLIDSMFFIGDFLMFFRGIFEDIGGNVIFLVVFCFLDEILIFLIFEILDFVVKVKLLLFLIIIFSNMIELFFCRIFNLFVLYNVYFVIMEELVIFKIVNFFFLLFVFIYVFFFVIYKFLF